MLVSEDSPVLQRRRVDPRFAPSDFGGRADATRAPRLHKSARSADPPGVVALDPSMRSARLPKARKAEAGCYP